MNINSQHKHVQFLMIVLFLTLSVIAVADDDDDDEGMQPLSQELFLSESPFVQESGEFQWTIDTSHIKSNEGDVSDFIIEMEYGFTEKFTVGISLPYIYHDAGSLKGFVDASLEILYGLINTETFVLTLGAEVNLLTGNEKKGLGEQERDWETSIGFAKQIGTAQFVMGFGLEVSDDETERFYSTALSIPVRNWVSIFELSGENSDDEDKLYLTPGALWRIGGNQEFQIGLPIGLTDDSADHGIIIKWNVEF